MTEENTPPILNSPPGLPAEEPGPSLAKWRYALACALLLGYVLGIGYLSSRATETIANPAPEATLLPPTVKGLLNLAAGEMALFGGVFLTALLLAKFRPRDLFLKWNGGVAPVWRGLGWSLLLRGLIAIAITIVAVVLTGGNKDVKSAKESLEVLRPKSEVLINPEALNDPLYLFLSFT